MKWRVPDQEVDQRKLGNTHSRTALRILSRTSWVSQPAQEETFTHSHLSWSSVIPYLLPPSITIHGILPVQFTCLTVFFDNLSPSFLWSTCWPGTVHFILYTFIHPLIVFFSQHMPIPLQPVVPRLCHLLLVSLSTLYLELLSCSWKRDCGKKTVRHVN